MLNIRKITKDKKYKKSEKGITLVALVITILVLLILASIIVTNGSDSLQLAKLNAFTAEMKIMQNNVNELYSKWKNGETVYVDGVECEIIGIGTSLAELSSDTQINVAFQGAEEEYSEDYRFYSQELIEELGIEGIKQEFLVNIKTRKIISYKGLKYQELMYYTLEQLPNGGAYNVGYENNYASGVQFDCSVKYVDTMKWKISISNIQYESNINKWTVKYKIKTETDWKTSDDLEFFVTKEGFYEIQLVHENIVQSQTQIAKVFVDPSLANEPQILTGMTEIMYTDPTETQKGSVIEKGDVSFKEENWSNYSEKRWGNAKTEDGSMWVWIPRYAYKITYYTSEDKTTVSETKTQYGSIDVKFLVGTTDQYYDDDGELQTAKRCASEDEVVDTTEGYTVHPAFTDERSINYRNGGWDKELEGIWIGKYEASRTDATESAEGSATTIKVVPNVQSFRNIAIGDMYTYAIQYNEELNSHMLKNSEWGAVAYLAHSEYGRNGVEVTINNSSSYITGNGADEISASGATGIVNAYNTFKGQLASTTGNTYGIYDMSGGAWEYVACYLKGGNGDSSGGFPMDGTTKYITEYSSAVEIEGDATTKTANWNADSYGFINTTSSFFRRGANSIDTTGAGIFSVGCYSGNAYGGYHGFRICIITN